MASLSLAMTRERFFKCGGRYRRQLRVLRACALPLRTLKSPRLRRI